MYSYCTDIDDDALGMSTKCFFHLKWKCKKCRKSPKCFLDIFESSLKKIKNCKKSPNLHKKCDCCHGNQNGASCTRSGQIYESSSRIARIATAVTETSVPRWKWRAASQASVLTEVHSDSNEKSEEESDTISMVVYHGDGVGFFLGRVFRASCE